MRGSREISLVPSQHRASTDALIRNCNSHHSVCCVYTVMLTWQKYIALVYYGNEDCQIKEYCCMPVSIYILCVLLPTQVGNIATTFLAVLSLHAVKWQSMEHS